MTTRCLWREVGTADLICLDPSDHDCPLRAKRTARRPMVSHPPKPHPVRDAVLGAWIVAWLVVGVAVLPGVLR